MLTNSRVRNQNPDDWAVGAEVALQNTGRLKSELVDAPDNEQLPWVFARQHLQA